MNEPDTILGLPVVKLFCEHPEAAIEKHWSREGDLIVHRCGSCGAIKLPEQDESWILPGREWAR